MLKRALFALTCFAAALGAAPIAAHAAGDLAIKATELEPLKLGSKESDYSMSVKEYTLETGKSYSLEISAYGYKEYELEAENFFRNIWVRYLEAGGVTIDAPVIDSVEFEEEGKVELVFVPIRTGTYEFKVAGLEEKGMVGKFVVK